MSNSITSLLNNNTYFHAHNEYFILLYIILFVPSMVITLASAQNTALNFDGSNDQINISYNSSLEVENR